MFRTLIIPKTAQPVDVLSYLKDTARPWVLRPDPICGDGVCLDYTNKGSGWLFAPRLGNAQLTRDLTHISKKMMTIDPGASVIVAEFKKNAGEEGWEEGGTRVEILQGGVSVHNETHYGNVINALAFLYENSSAEIKAKRCGALWSANTEQRTANQQTSHLLETVGNVHAAMSFYLKFSHGMWPLKGLSREEQAGILYMSAYLDMASVGKIEKCFNEMGQMLGIENPSTGLNLVFSFDKSDQIISWIRLEEIITSMMTMDVAPASSVDIDDQSLNF